MGWGPGLIHDPLRSSRLLEPRRQLRRSTIMSGETGVEACVRRMHPFRLLSHGRDCLSKEGQDEFPSSSPSLPRAFLAAPIRHHVPPRHGRNVPGVHALQSRDGRRRARRGNQGKFQGIRDTYAFVPRVRGREGLVKRRGVCSQDTTSLGASPAASAGPSRRPLIGVVPVLATEIAECLRSVQYRRRVRDDLDSPGGPRRRGCWEGDSGRGDRGGPDRKVMDLQARMLPGFGAVVNKHAGVATRAWVFVDPFVLGWRSRREAMDHD